MKRLTLILSLLVMIPGLIAQEPVDYNSTSIGITSSNEKDVHDIDPHKALQIFFLGNSFTGANDLPNIVNELAIAADMTCYIEAHAPGGQFSTDHCVNPYVYEKINSRDWDFVVIQDNQGAFVNTPPYVSTTTIDANTQLYDSIKANNICTSVIWFAGWAGEGGYPQYFPGDNTEACIERLLANVVYMNSSMGEVVAPIGEGWIRSLTEQPAIDLYTSDGAHPSLEGSYLTASVLYSLMFKDNPTQIAYDAGLSSTDALYLRTVGYDVVTEYNNQTEYNIISITPEIIYESGQFTTTNSYFNYLWIFGSQILSGETNQYTQYIDPGFYAIYILDQNHCQQRSFDQEFGALTVASFTYVQDNGLVSFTDQSVNANSWEWDFGDGNFSTVENPIHTYTTSGVFTVTLSATGVGTDIASDQISITLSIDKINNKEFSIFPNPCTDNFIFENSSNESINGIVIYDANGNLIISYNENILSGGSFRVDTDKLKSGFYILTFNQDNTGYQLPLIVK